MSCEAQALSGDIDKNDRYTFIYIHRCMWPIASYLRGYVMTTKVLLQFISFMEFGISHILPFLYLNLHFTASCISFPMVMYQHKNSYLCLAMDCKKILHSNYQIVNLKLDSCVMTIARKLCQFNAHFDYDQFYKAHV